MAHNHHKIIMKTHSLAFIGKSRMLLEFLQSLISKEFTLFDLSGISLEDSTCKAVLFDLTWKSPRVKTLFPRGDWWILHMVVVGSGTGTGWIPEPGRGGSQDSHEKWTVGNGRGGF